MIATVVRWYEVSQFGGRVRPCTSADSDVLVKSFRKCGE